MILLEGAYLLLKHATFSTNEKKTSNDKTKQYICIRNNFSEKMTDDG